MGHLTLPRGSQAWANALHKELHVTLHPRIYKGQTEALFATGEIEDQAGAELPMA